MAIKKITKQAQHNVVCLAASGASPTMIRKKTGLHMTTVKRILAEPKNIATREEVEQQLLDSFMDVAVRSLAAIDEAKLDKSSARDLSIIAGVALDKSRLISGKSTSNLAILVSSAVRDLPVEMTPLQTDGDI